MKRKIRIAVALGLMAALFMAGHAAPALADDGSLDASERLRPPHPCAISANLRLQWESELQQQDDLYDILEDLEEELNRLNRRIWDWHAEHSSELSSVPCTNADSECVLDYFDRLIRMARERDDTSRAAKLEELANELRSLCAERDEFRNEQYNPAENRYQEARSQADSSGQRYRQARRECNLTRPVISVTEHPWDSQTPQPMSMFDSSLREQMQDPMGSDANQASSETHYVIPFGVQEQPPQSAVGQVAMSETDAPAVTPSRARLFNTPLQRSTPDDVQSTPAATGQIMQVDQSGSSNTGTSSFGYTHMPLPQNAGQSGTAVAPPPKSLRILTPMRRMRISPGRSIKR